MGIAKESARFLLPSFTASKLYMQGTLRSWITYLLVRLNPATQKEHRDIAVGAFHILQEKCPIIASAILTIFEQKGIEVDLAKHEA